MPDPTRPWFGPGRPAWLASVAAWVNTSVGGFGASGPALEPVKERAWGAVFRVRGGAEPCIFKATGPRGRHETRIVADLGAGSAVGGASADVLAVDHARGWLLLRDHGRPMAELGAAEQVELVARLLPGYAELQRASRPRLPAWLAAGMADRSPVRLPALLDELLAAVGAVAGGPPVVAVAAIASELAAGGPEPTVDHGDIHGTNVVVGAGGPRLIDWGDACAAHPFTSLLTPIEWVAGRLPRDEVPGAVARLRDAYLEGWGRDGDRLVAGRAVWLGYVARAVSNLEQTSGGPPADVVDARREIAALLSAWRAKADRLDDAGALLLPVLENI